MCKCDFNFSSGGQHPETAGAEGAINGRTRPSTSYEQRKGEDVVETHVSRPRRKVRGTKTVKSQEGKQRESIVITKRSRVSIVSLYTIGIVFIKHHISEDIHWFLFYKLWIYKGKNLFINLLVALSGSNKLLDRCHV